MFSAIGAGLFPAAVELAEDLEGLHQALQLGEVLGLSVSYLAMTVQRYLKRPAVAAIYRRAPA